MSRLKADTQMTLISRIPVMLLGFLSVVFLTRLLGPEGNGVYTFTIAALNLMLTVIGFQLDGSLPVFLAKNKEDEARVFSSVLVLAIISILTFLLILIILVFLIPFSRSWIIPSGQPVIFFFCFISILFIIRKLSNLLLAALRGLFRFRSYNGLMIFNQLIPSAVYGLLLVLTISGPTVISPITCFTVILCTEGILLAIGIILLLRTHALSFSKDYKTYLKPIFFFSTKNLLQASGHFLNKRLDVWFVELYKGTASLGQYGLATQVANFISDAMTPFTQVLVPYVAGSPADQHRSIVERTARLNLTIAFIAAICIISTSWVFIPLIFGNEFRLAIAATQILAFGVIFISQRLVFVSYFKAINQQRFAVQASWTGVLITVVLDILLIPRYGIVGASWATVFAYGATTFYLIFTAQKILGFSWSGILLIQKSDIQWLLSRTHKDSGTGLHQ